MIILVLVKSTASKLENIGSQYFHKTDFSIENKKKTKENPQNMHENIPVVLKQLIVFFFNILNLCFISISLENYIMEFWHF